MMFPASLSNSLAVSQEHQEGGNNAKLVKKLGRMLDGLNRNMFYAFFPICTGSHFCLVYVHFPHCVWRFYNPLSGRSQLYPHHRKAADKFTQFMNVVMAGKLGWFGLLDWKMTQIAKAPWQQNLKDCGIFIMMYVAHLASNVNPPEFDQSTITRLWRPVIASTLIRGVINSEFDDDSGQGTKDAVTVAGFLRLPDKE